VQIAKRHDCNGVLQFLFPANRTLISPALRQARALNVEISATCDD
jgi:hypothetical protein